MATTPHTAYDAITDRMIRLANWLDIAPATIGPFLGFPVMWSAAMSMPLLRSQSGILTMMASALLGFACALARG